MTCCTTMYIMCTRKVGVIYVQYLPIEFYLKETYNG